MKLVKNQHYVPRFYLRQWCFPGKETIYVYDKEKDEIRTNNIENIASERFFYDFELKDYFSETIIEELNSSRVATEGRFQILEHMFSDKLEGPFSKILSEITDKARRVTPWHIDNCFFITPEMKEAISVYLAFQFIRTSSVRSDIMKSAENITNHLEKMGVKEEIIQKYTLSKQAAKKIHNRMLLDKEEMTKTACLFNRLTWILGINRTETRFLTSDSPIGMKGHDIKKPPFLGTGLASPGVELCFPLSPDLILIMVDGDYHKHMVKNERRYAELKKNSLIDYYNSIQILQAKRSTFSCDGDFAILSILKQKNPHLFSGMNRSNSIVKS